MLPSTLDMVPPPSTWNPRPSTLDKKIDSGSRSELGLPVVQCVFTASWRDNMFTNHFIHFPPKEKKVSSNPPRGK